MIISRLHLTYMILHMHMNAQVYISISYFLLATYWYHERDDNIRYTCTYMTQATRVYTKTQSCFCTHCVCFCIKQCILSASSKQVNCCYTAIQNVRAVNFCIYIQKDGSWLNLRQSKVMKG